ncbi:MAG: hypothetical protein K0R57_2131 [Paenibacillaceae bacterium]|jgi:hypothetical protein|nr:hypothetical protein [Paenibacillaceae bacterium]
MRLTAVGYKYRLGISNHTYCYYYESEGAAWGWLLLL